MPGCSSFGPSGVGWDKPYMGDGHRGAETMPFLDGRPKEDEQSTNQLHRIRGGNLRSRDSPSGLLSILSEFWESSFAKASSNIRKFFSKRDDKDDELLEKLRTTPVRAVTVPNSTVLPPDVIRVAVKRSGQIGNPLRADRVQEIAKSIKRWYIRNGYVLHSVSGAVLKADSAVAEITVDEPIVSIIPVEITVCKEMIIDENGDLVTFRQYLEQQKNKRSFRHGRIEKKNLNTTFVEASGRTSPSKVARAMNLRPGGAFQWNSARWDKVATSGIFSDILRVTPRRLNDGSVQLQVYATEPPPRHLEYGLGKSLYTGSWEGEVDFEHTNLFGGGEVVGLVVRRGTRDVEPSVRLRYSDDRFGLGRGFDFEVFSDFLGDNAGDLAGSSSADGMRLESSDLCFRKGTTVRINDPIKARFAKNRLQASLERTSSRSGKHENIGSTTITLGPLRLPLPLDARASLVTSVTGGARLGDPGDDVTIMPYTSGSATTRQLFPLSDPSKDIHGSSPVLALQHTVAASSRNLPRHEAKAMGVSSQIRGCGPDGGATSSLKGTAELRFPVSLPRLKNGAVVLFGDWYFIQENHFDSFRGKSSIGFGFRKNVQGLPLKYDVCYTSDGKVKTMFGLGPDFDA